MIFNYNCLGPKASETIGQTLLSSNVFVNQIREALQFRLGVALAGRGTHTLIELVCV